MGRKDIGLLIIRVGIGVMFVLHGIPKIAGGPDTWQGLAGAVIPGVEGVVANALGLSAAIAEIAGGILLALGIPKLYQVGMILLIGVMAGATLSKLTAGGFTFMTFAYNVGWPLEMMILFIGLLLIGPGRLVVGSRGS
ncbi:MAG: DoxX family protein [Opitutales bacterium]